MVVEGFYGKAANLCVWLWLCLDSVYSLVILLQQIRLLLSIITDRCKHGSAGTPKPNYIKPYEVPKSRHPDCECELLGVGPHGSDSSIGSLVSRVGFASQRSLKTGIMVTLFINVIFRTFLSISLKYTKTYPKTANPYHYFLLLFRVCQGSMVGERR